MQEPAVRHTSSYDAVFDAQRIAFAPMTFQAAKALRDLGILAALDATQGRGASLTELLENTDVSRYALRVLLEAGVAIGVLQLRRGDHFDGKFALTKTGHFLLHDEMTRVNMDFVNDVCYRGMFHLGEALEQGKPAGLKVFGEWATVYEALAHLPAKAQTSWFRFDHFYSDGAFPDALPIVFERQPQRLLDIGGNTGKWALQCTAYDAAVQVTIMDLPGQLTKALAAASAVGRSERIEGLARDVLKADVEAPPAVFDAVWMSQFLVCFSEDEIIHILKLARRALNGHGSLYILDTYWDRQPNDVAAYCLIQSSLYFTAMANGNSRMYHSRDMLGCIEAAGLVVADEHDGLGLSHTLLRCVPEA